MIKFARISTSPRGRFMIEFKKIRCCREKDSFIVLDDPSASLDAEKIENVKELIKDLSKKWQIIYFTCHESRKL